MQYIHPVVRYIFRDFCKHHLHFAQCNPTTLFYDAADVKLRTIQLDHVTL
jgi:hypothetical protein